MYALLRTLIMSYVFVMYVIIVYNIQYPQKLFNMINMFKMTLLNKVLRINSNNYKLKFKMLIQNLEKVMKENNN